MFKEFALVDMAVNPIEKQIKLFFTSNVDPDTVDSDTIAMVHAEFQKIYRLKYRTSKKTVVITVLDDVEPNEEYRLDINKTIKDIVGTPLQSSLIRHVYFNSNIYSNVRIISPANHERKPVLEYRLQISENKNFDPCEIDTVILNKQRISFPQLKDAKQYYIRIRVEKDGEFGAWSDIATFTYDGKDRVLDRLEKSEKDPHKINPVSIWAPYNYKRNMHNNKVNLDTNPTPSGTMSADEVNNATGLGLSSEVTASNNTATSLSEAAIERIMKDGNGNSATTIKLADGTIITRANDSGSPGVVVDETPAGTNIAPVIISALEVTRRPQQGTNDAFVFEFNAEIKDEGILQNIEIIRKDF